MNITMPIALSDTEIWVLVERDDCPCGECIDAARVAITLNGTFMALPTDDFYTNEQFPASRRTGESFPQLAWANVNDIAANPQLFQEGKPLPGSGNADS